MWLVVISAVLRSLPCHDVLLVVFLEKNNRPASGECVVIAFSDIEYHRSITLKVVTLPGTQFEGHANVTFTAIDVVANSSTTSTIEILSGRHGIDDDDSNPGSSVSHQEVAGGPLSSTHGGIVPVLQETSSDGASNKASFHVEFYHCRAGSFWKPTVSSVVSSDEDPGACYACSENTLNGETEVRAVVAVTATRGIGVVFDEVAFPTCARLVAVVSFAIFRSGSFFHCRSTHY